ncbi:DUF3795 domain-containing protein [Oscillibacter sp.]|nr:DUF3795 domain-containing protein [Oscillibacter sp.]
MEYRERAYPLYSACGLNCGLCPRYHAAGTSKCPGCAGKGFLEKHPTCGVLSCAQRRGLDYCFLCEEYPCKKYDGADAADSFISHKNQMRDNDRARRAGMEACQAELNEKTKLLKVLLENYDDGRRKSFFCIAVNLLELPDVKRVMARLTEETQGEASPKGKAEAAARLFQAMAEKRGIALQLRKKTKAATS